MNIPVIYDIVCYYYLFIIITIYLLIIFYSLLLFIHLLLYMTYVIKMQAFTDNNLKIKINIEDFNADQVTIVQQMILFIWNFLKV